MDGLIEVAVLGLDDGKVGMCNRAAHGRAAWLILPVCVQPCYLDAAVRPAVPGKTLRPPGKTTHVNSARWTPFCGQHAVCLFSRRPLLVSLAAWR